jgi:pyrroloquinoline quinone biosynthesis protein B
MRVIILGSAAGGGFPQWNSNAPACRRARAGDAKAEPRTQSSLAVSGDDRHWFLLNASPDLRVQIERTPELHPREGLRSTPIAGVVLTSADVDHVAGLLSLRENQPFTIYASQRVHRVLAANSIFNVLNPAVVRRETIGLDESVRLADPLGRAAGITIEMFAVPGKVALYQEDATAGPGFGTAPGDTVGLQVSETGNPAKHFYYLPGCAAMPPELARRLAGAPLVLFDGTLWRDDEMIRAGLGSKTGLRMGHMSLEGKQGTLAAFADLGVKRKILVHMNNSNPVLLADSPERAIATQAGWEIGRDGMDIRL